jgi:hypothetical protein
LSNSFQKPDANFCERFREFKVPRVQPERYIFEAVAIDDHSVKVVQGYRGTVSGSELARKARYVLGD